MSTIHISTDNGLSCQYDESQVASLLQQGLLRSDMLFWKEGMDGWRPLRNLFPPSLAVVGREEVITLPSPLTVERVTPSIPQESSTPHYAFIKNPFGLTRALKVMLWVDLFGSLLYFPAKVSAPALLMFILVSFILKNIIFLMWVYRANLNCHGFAAKGMEFTPGWAVGFFFIPFLNFWKPYQVISEIWKVSSDPKNRKAQNASLIRGWWEAKLGLVLMSFFSGVLGAVMALVVFPPHLIWGSPLFVFLELAFIVFMILEPIETMKLVTRIIEKQTKLTGSNR